ncbi:hypothetical protein BJX68DRAFT_188350 [Aspergillus pseudodeflectus]|uniref:Uncharacterized protein n=1 Tax=Aspergillus pseudodeflectus TaxID=176178 RepID=A0ABR4JJK9_9EURO
MTALSLSPFSIGTIILQRTLGGIHVPVCPGSLLPSFDGYYETDGPYQGPVGALARGHGDSFLFLIAMDNNLLITAAVQDRG